MIHKPKSKFHDEWFTPMEIIEALGPFDLDPACGRLCPNKTATVQYGPRENGLKKPWHGRVWLNPPFSNVRPFVDKLIAHGNGILLIFMGSKARWQLDMVRAAGGGIHV